MKRTKRFLALLLASLMLVLALPYAASAAIASGDDLGAYMKGYPDGTFLPDNNMTRAEAITLLFRLVADKNKETIAYTTKFTDVAKEDWYYKYIAYFDTNRYLTDYGPTFEPNKNITRAEFVKLILSIDKKTEYMYRTFVDVPKDSPYYESICIAASNGIVSGYPDGTFRPDGNITRAEVVTVVNRFINRVATGNPGTNAFIDIDAHWARDGIIAAANEKVCNGVTVWTDDQVKTYSYEPTGASYTENVDQLFNIYDTMTTDEYVNAVDTVIDARIAEILNYGNGTEIEPTGNGIKYYVSSSTGNDANDGLTPETAWATLTKVQSINYINGSVVLFKRGDLWRGSFTAKGGVTYSAYGTGIKPRIYHGAKDYRGKSNWEATEWPNVYKLKDKVDRVGIIAFDHPNDPNSLETIYHVEGLVGHKRQKGRNFAGPQELNRDLDFYSDIDTQDFYLYSADGNPGQRFNSIEIGPYGNTVGANGGAIDNLCILYTGSHGIGFGTSTMLVSNCCIGWLGGGDHGTNDTYGNAIEIYGGSPNFNVHDNYCYQCYDTGITLQYGGGGDCIQQNVNINRNVVEYCFWGLEFYNTGYGEDDKRLCKDYDVSYNVVRFTGFGWGRGTSGQAYQSCGLTPNTENYKVYKNIFYAANTNGTLVNLPAGGDEKIDFTDNIYIQATNKPFASYCGKSYRGKFDLVDTMRGVMGQTNPLIVYKDVVPAKKTR